MKDSKAEGFLRQIAEGDVVDQNRPGPQGPRAPGQEDLIGIEEAFLVNVGLMVEIPLDNQ